MKKNQKRKKVFGKKKKEENEKTGLKPKAQGWTLHSERPIREAKNPSAKWPGGRKSNAESKHIYLKIILNL